MTQVNETRSIQRLRNSSTGHLKDKHRPSIPLSELEAESDGDEGQLVRASAASASLTKRASSPPQEEPRCPHPTWDPLITLCSFSPFLFVFSRIS